MGLFKQLFSSSRKEALKRAYDRKKDPNAPVRCPICGWRGFAKDCDKMRDTLICPESICVQPAVKFE